MPGDPDSELVATRSPTAVSTKSGGQTLVLNSTTGRFIRLNTSGSELWELLQVSRSSRELADHLVTRWQLPHDRAHADALSFLRSLAERELVDLRGAAQVSELG